MNSIDIARVDQMVAAVQHGQRLAPTENKWLADPEAGDSWTRQALLEAATGRGFYGDAERADGAPRPVTVNGNAPWPDADDIDTGDEDPLALLGIDECGRCLSIQSDAVVVVRNVLLVPAGRTAVEMSYCDGCAADLDAHYTQLTWKVRSERAAV